MSDGVMVGSIRTSSGLRLLLASNIGLQIIAIALHVFFPQIAAAWHEAQFEAAA